PRRRPRGFPAAGPGEGGRPRVGPRVAAPPPGSGIGAPLVAAGRTMGAISVSSDRAGALGKPEVTLVSLVLAQGVIALENARLVELLSSAKREWEKTVDAISQAICIVDAH